MVDAAVREEVQADTDPARRTDDVLERVRTTDPVKARHVFAGFIGHFKAKKIALTGHKDSETACFIRETCPEVEISDEPDIVFLDIESDDKELNAALDKWLPVLKGGGMIAGRNYNDKHVSIMRTVAQRFCLMDVGCSPDSVWFVFKGEPRAKA